MHRLTLFGRFCLTDSNDREIILKSAKAKALLAYLARSVGEPHSRDQIMALLWSDRDEVQARASLRQVLTGLRKALGDNGKALLRIDSDSIEMNPKAIFITEGRADEFLSGLRVNDPAFDDWLRDERLRLEGPPPAAETETEGPDKPYVAVLPFTNLSGDPEQQYFADGITEDIITELARVHTLWVIGRSSSFAYQDASNGDDEGITRLGANYVVRGSVRRAGDHIRITAQLIDVTTGAHIWADRYDRSVEDIFAVQDEVVAAVVASLNLSLSDLEIARAKTRPTQNLSAYDLLLRGRSFWWHGNENDAYEFTRRSVQADPTYATAHAYFALQNAYQFYSRSLGMSLDDIAENCKRHAETALELDDTNPIVHAYASMAFGFSPLAAKDRGVKHARIAASLNPHDCEIMLFLAWQLAFAGQPEDAIALLDRVAVLNPLGDYMIAECRLDASYMLGNYEQAVECYRDLAGVAHHSLVVLAACYAMLDQPENTQETLAELDRVKPASFDTAELARAQIKTCALEKDKAHWRRGFRLIGLAV